MRFPAVLVAGALLALVSVPADAQTLAEASAAAKAARATGMGWAVSTSLGPPPVPPPTAAEQAEMRSTFGEIYAAGKALDAAATTGAIAQVRDRLIAFKAAVATVTDQPTHAPAVGGLLTQYQRVADRFDAGLDAWALAIRSNLSNRLAILELRSASSALTAANTVYLGKDAK